MAAQQKCHECGKVARCRMHLVGEAKVITYVCAACERALGYRREQ